MSKGDQLAIGQSNKIPTSRMREEKKKDGEMKERAAKGNNGKEMERKRKKKTREEKYCSLLCDTPWHQVHKSAYTATYCAAPSQFLRNRESISPPLSQWFARNPGELAMNSR